ncbi:MAG: subclass B3 metallo-beta-lactamase [Terricaulis sp.]
MLRPILVCLLFLLGCSTAPPRLASDSEIGAAETAPLSEYAINGRWNEPFEPFNVIGNIYYVGTAGVSSHLITTPQGHFLLDGILPQSAPQIIANIAALGFDVRDVRYLLNSHAHFDHAGGLAGLQRASGATLVASAADKPVLEAGDIGYGPSAGMRFPPVRVDRMIGDGESLNLGGVTLTAHLTPGHTAGCTSWSMPVVGADGARHTAFFHCSATVAGQSLVPESYPGMVEAFRATFAAVRRIDADVFLANHDNFFGLQEKRARQRAGDVNAFVAPGELHTFNARMEAAFEEELARQLATGD